MKQPKRYHRAKNTWPPCIRARVRGTDCTAFFRQLNLCLPVSGFGWRFYLSFRELRGRRIMWHVKPFDTGTDTENRTGGYTNKMDLTCCLEQRCVVLWTCIFLPLFGLACGLMQPGKALWDSELKKSFQIKGRVSESRSFQKECGELWNTNKGIIMGLLSLSELLCARQLTEGNCDVRC
jgi:hypothetical protein